MKKNTSIYDIAKSLNVSASTVSRALQDHPRISSEVRKMVQKKAREMNYRPNRMAVNLKMGKCNTIGVVVPNINRNFFSSAIDGIEEEAYREGYDVLICQSQELYEKEKKQNVMKEEHIDRVLELYNNRESVEKEAYLASYEDIVKNDYNLNIPRYVDTSEEEPEIDLKVLTLRMRDTDKEIKEGNNMLLSMLKDLNFDSDETRESVEEFIKVLEEV